MNAAKSTDKIRITTPKPILPAYITPTPGKKIPRMRARNGLYSPVTGISHDVVRMFGVDASNSVIHLSYQQSQNLYNVELEMWWNLQTAS